MKKILALLLVSVLSLSALSACKVNTSVSNSSSSGNITDGVGSMTKEIDTTINGKNYKMKIYCASSDQFDPDSVDVNGVHIFVKFNITDKNIDIRSSDESVLNDAEIQEICKRVTAKFDNVKDWEKAEKITEEEIQEFIKNREENK